MKKRRIEIVVLAALMIFAAAERSEIQPASVDLRPELYQVGQFAPQRVDDVRDLGMLAVKLLVTWVG